MAGFKSYIQQFFLALTYWNRLFANDTSYIKIDLVPFEIYGVGQIEPHWKNYI